jgi:paraquat-inducible protein B
MTEAHAAVSQKRGINPIWFVPILAVALGIFLVIYTIQSQGPTVTITFATAEGLEAGKTKVKLREVEIGIVETIRIGEDLESVVVEAALDPQAEELLREETEFWVVRARFGKSGISGLGTLLSGGYIQLEPGGGDDGKRSFVGLEDPPVTPPGTPGMRVGLTAERAGSVSAGDPLLFRGYQVGQVETEFFDPETKLMTYGVFVHAPYHELLTDSHRFWDTSGVSIHLGADGIQMDSVALETLLIGGVEVGRPTGVGMGAPVEEGAVFELYSNFAAVNERPYRHSVEYVVRFPQSVRGVLPGAPVEYRGIQIGRVERVMLRELAQNMEGKGQPIPILISLSPARMEAPDSPEGIERVRAAIAESASRGLRATLATGNLLTGSLYISLDVYPDSEIDQVGEWEGYATIPTIAAGFEGIQVQLMAFLRKLNDLPLKGTVLEAKNALAAIDSLVSGEGMQNLPQALDKTLRELEVTLASMSGDSELQARLLPTISELERTLSSLRKVLDTLDEQPNALIFNRRHRDDPRPRTGSK